LYFVLIIVASGDMNNLIVPYSSQITVTPNHFRDLMLTEFRIQNQWPITSWMGENVAINEDYQGWLALKAKVDPCPVYIFHDRMIHIQYDL